MFAKLLRASVGERAHVALGPELQAAGRTRLDARRPDPLPAAVRAQRALITLLRRAVELRNIERAAGHAVLTADAVLLLKVDDAVRVLDDGAVGGTRAQTSRILAVHALVLAHQPLQRAIVVLMFVEFDQVPVVPRRRRHRLVRVVERRLLERHVVPLDARDLARLAPDARRHVDVLAHLFFALDAAARHAAGMSGDSFDLKNAGRHETLHHGGHEDAEVLSSVSPASTVVPSLSR